MRLSRECTAVDGLVFAAQRDRENLVFPTVVGGRIGGGILRGRKIGGVLFAAGGIATAVGGFGNCAADGGHI